MYQESILALRKFVAPEFVFGANAMELAGRYARNFGAGTVLVVTDPGVVGAGIAGRVIESLESAGLRYVVFADVRPNPDDGEVMAGVRVYEENGCNLIVAVGGGSPMDCAKGIGIASTSGRNILEFEGVDNVPVPGPPLVCIPTTAGTSADVSQFAIIRDRARKLKIAIVSKTVVPDVALIDPTATLSMPRELTACTGMDALTHAIEAYVSNAHSPYTDLSAFEAIRMISSSLPAVLDRPDDLELRGRVMLGSLEAGLAFSNASLGAVHAMAHSLGGLLDLPHGQCNASLLPYVMDYNFGVAPRRFRDIGEALGLSLKGADNARIKEAVLDRIRALRRETGTDRSLSSLGVRREGIPELAYHAMEDSCMATNPRQPDLKDIEAIFENAL
jgi:alcohol dehydrogenase class IV